MLLVSAAAATGSAAAEVKAAADSVAAMAEVGSVAVQEVEGLGAAEVVATAVALVDLAEAAEVGGLVMCTSLAPRNSLEIQDREYPMSCSGTLCNWNGISMRC
jgi:hypothetical protein